MGSDKETSGGVAAMLKFTLLFVLGLKAANAVAPFELVVEEWETWKLTHGKSYGKMYGDALGATGNSLPGSYSQEESFRMKIWMENKAKIEKHNRRAVQGLKSYHLAMNQFGDLLHHEFVSIVNGYIPKKDF